MIYIYLNFAVPRSLAFLFSLRAKGNLDAIVGILGMIFGSYLFALGPHRIEATIGHWGARGKLTLPMLFNRSRGLLVAIMAPLMAVLLALEIIPHR